jgi:sulfatase modifying factor 1
MLRLLLAVALVLPLPLAAQARGGGTAASGAPGPGAGAAWEGMAVIPAGRYMPLYAPDTAAVRVESFRMDRFPVTRSEFAAFVEAEPRWRRGAVKPVFADGRYLADWASDLEPGGNPRAPVTGVSWFAARSYCAWRGKRLPTVDEWEYVARADETRRDAMTDPRHKARILELYTGRPDTPPAVGSTFANLYGVHDLHGLVWEWIRDFNTVTVGADSRGTGQRDVQLYCAAGAEGATDTTNYAAFLRYAFRASLEGRSTSAALGFRCAADL